MVGNAQTSILKYNCNNHANGESANYATQIIQSHRNAKRFLKLMFDIQIAH